jgi:hypothetical protein
MMQNQGEKGEGRERTWMRMMEITEVRSSCKATYQCIMGSLAKVL